MVFLYLINKTNYDCANIIMKFLVIERKNTVIQQFKTILSLLFHKNSLYWKNKYFSLNRQFLKIKYNKIDISYLLNLNTISYSNYSYAFPKTIITHSPFWYDFWKQLFYVRYSMCPKLRHKHLGIKRYCYEETPTRHFTPILAFRINKFYWDYDVPFKVCHKKYLW